MQVEVCLDYVQVDTLTANHLKYTSNDGQVVVNFNQAAGGQVFASVCKESIISTDSIPKSQIDLQFKLNGQNHYLTLTPTS